MGGSEADKILKFPSCGLDIASSVGHTVVLECTVFWVGGRRENRKQSAWRATRDEHQWRHNKVG